MFLKSLTWKILLGRLLLSVVSSSAVAFAAYADNNSRDADWGVVYTSTNAAAGNAVVVLSRGSDGSLSPSATVATDGLGSGGGLGNQGALAITKSGRWLFVVNAGSNDISVFKVNHNGLQLTNRTPSGGIRPVSLTVHEDMLYVLNAGGVNNITGFNIGEEGRLTAIPESTRALSADATGPAQVEFSRDGELLVVTEKATNKISLYTVENGIAKGPTVRDSNGATPFGFSFDRRGHLIVSEAFGGAPGASALSSYNVDDDTPSLQLISPSVGTTQTAACWVVVTKNGRYAYTTNTGSGTVSGYRVDRNGKLSLLNADGLTAVIGAGTGPTDAALSRDSKFLYVLNRVIGTISAWRVEPNGSLTPITGASGIATSATGLVAR